MKEWFMIIKIDHIAISTPYIENAIQYFHKLGYATEFLLPQVKNSEIKKPFLSHFSETHNVSLLLKNKCFSIELLDHGQLSETQSFMIPVFESFPYPLNKNEQIVLTSSTQLFRSYIDELDIWAYVKYNLDECFIFNTIVFKTPSIEASFQFWTHFGFKPQELTETYAKLEFKTPFNRYPFYIILTKDKTNCTSKKMYLNSNGFSYMAFITNSDESEKKRLIGNALNVTQTDTIDVNNKRLNIFFVKGPCNEFVEIISLVKPDRTIHENERRNKNNND